MAVTSEVPPAASSCPATACSGNSPLLLGARAASGQGGGGAGPPAPPLLDARVCQTSRGSGALSPGLRGRTAACGGPHRLLLATERTLGSARPPGLLGSSLLAGERVRELPAPSRHPWRLGRVTTCIPRPHQLLSLLQPVTTCPACRTRGVGAVGKGQNNREPSQQGLRGARGRRAPRPGCRRGATTWGPGPGAEGASASYGGGDRVSMVQVASEGPHEGSPGRLARRRTSHRLSRRRWGPGVTRSLHRPFPGLIPR